MSVKSNLENVFSQLSNIDNVDDALKDEGLTPEQVVKNGMEKLQSIKSNQVSKKRVVDLIKIKMSESISKETLKAINSLSKLIPSMNSQQIDMVFRNLSDSSENSSDLGLLVKNLKSDSELRKIMNENRSQTKD